MKKVPEFIEKQLCIFCKKYVSREEIDKVQLYAHEKCWKDEIDRVLHRLVCKCPRGCRECASREATEE